MPTTTAEDVLSRCRHLGRDALIPVLQEIQDQDGYLSREAIIAVGKHLRLPASKVYGVATFYNQFRFQPLGRFHIQVCRGTACHVKGSAAVLSGLEQALSVEAGQTSRDGLFSLEVVACIGACSLAPVISVNSEIHAGVSVDDIEEILDSYRRKARQDDGIAE